MISPSLSVICLICQHMERLQILPREKWLLKKRLMEKVLRWEKNIKRSEVNASFRSTPPSFCDFRKKGIIIHDYWQLNKLFKLFSRVRPLGKRNSVVVDGRALEFLKEFQRIWKNIN